MDFLSPSPPLLLHFAVLKGNPGDGEVAPWLETQVALLEELGSILRSHAAQLTTVSTAYDYSSRGSGLYEHQTHTHSTQTYMQVNH